MSNIMEELEQSDHFAAARLERTRRLLTRGDHAHELTDFANGLRNSAIRLKQIMSNEQISEEVRVEAQQLLSRTSRLLDQIKAALRE
jgi:hypothetical protein